jgi:hypothetical protein
MSRQHDASTQPARKKQLADAVAEIDRRIAEVESARLADRGWFRAFRNYLSQG